MLLSTSATTAAAIFLILAAIQVSSVILPPTEETQQPSEKPRNVDMVNSCWKVGEFDRVDCHPEANVTATNCMQRGCCWSGAASASTTLKTPSSSSSTFSSRSRSSPPRVRDVPTCYFPPAYNRTYYNDGMSASDRIIRANLKLQQPTTFNSPDVNPLFLTAFYETPTRFHLTIDDEYNKRWQTPYPILQNQQQKPTATATNSSTEEEFKTKIKFQIADVNDRFGFTVSRADDNAVLFDANDVGAPLIFTDQLISLSARLPNVQAVYGLGEHWDRLNRIGQKFTFFNMDTSPASNGVPGYGLQPFFVAIGNNGNGSLLSYGVYLHSSNAMEVEITESGVITYRITGGMLDMYFFIAPTPEEVVREYLNLVGKPQMPPYWSLGYHLCRWGYANVSETERIHNRNIAAGIPVQTQWNDIDYMVGKQDFTHDPVNFGNLSAFVQTLHAAGKNYVPIVDIGIPNFLPAGSYPPYDEGTVDNVWILSPNGTSPLVGQVWPGSVVYPDFTHPNASDWWGRQVARFHSEIEMDGMWIDMNEPSSFVDGSSNGCPSLANGNDLDYPAYQPPLYIHDNYFGHSICMAAQHHVGTHYNVHNILAYGEAIATHAAMTQVLAPSNRRPFVVTRANSAGIGVFSNHWSGDVFSTWYDLQRSIAHMLEYNMLGVPMVGSDICGFNGNTNEELCLRWHQVGAFYPFSRNHNTLGALDQDPAAWSQPTITAIRNVLNLRLQLLPYYYSLLCYASFHGGTVVRAMSFEFPYDSTTYSMDWQFMVGSSLMVVPVLDAGADSVEAYFPLGPNQDEIWYDFFTGEAIYVADAVANGGYKILPAPLDTVNVLLRGGNIVPLQHEAMTVRDSRKNDFYLYVALNASAQATGVLYWDNGDDNSVPTGPSQEFNLIFLNASVGPQAKPLPAQCVLTNATGWVESTPMLYGYDNETMTVGSVRISGVKESPSSEADSGSVWYVPTQSADAKVEEVSQWSFNATTLVLNANLSGLNATMDKQWAVFWC